MTAILIIIILVVVAAAVAGGVLATRARRKKQLRGQFGPEYDRAVEGHGSERDAQRALEGRQERRSQLDIRPLDPGERDHYAETWRATQSRFVDRPEESIREADVLVAEVMRRRGYPMDDFDQRAADVSVDHPHVVENYRAAHEISGRHEQGQASTEELRRAMVHYRALFDELLGEGSATTAHDGAAAPAHGHAAEQPAPAQDHPPAERRPA